MKLLPIWKFFRIISYLYCALNRSLSERWTEHNSVDLVWPVDLLSILVEEDPFNSPEPSVPDNLKPPLGNDSRNSRRNGTHVEMTVTVCRVWPHIIQGQRLLVKKGPDLSNPFTKWSCTPDTIISLDGKSPVRWIEPQSQKQTGGSQDSNTQTSHHNQSFSHRHMELKHQDTWHCYK